MFACRRSRSKARGASDRVLVRYGAGRHGDRDLRRRLRSLAGGSGATGRPGARRGLAGDSLQRYDRPSDADFLAEHTLGEYLPWLNTDSLLYSNYQVYNRYFVRMGSFEGPERKLSWEGDLAGDEVVFAGDFSGFPVRWAKRIVRSIGGTVAEVL